MNIQLNWIDGKLCLGKVLVGTVHYSGLVSREDPKKYVAHSSLPKNGNQVRLGHFEKPEAAMKAVEDYVYQWIKRAFD